MRLVSAMSELAFAIAAIACAGSTSTLSPYCASPALLPETSPDCRASTVLYQQALLDVVDAKLRSEHFGSLDISAEFDPVSRLPRVCIGRELEPVPSVVHQQVASCNGALRGFPPGPACLSGTRLDLTEALLTASESSGLRR
jgi:hypothetical protein